MEISSKFNSSISFKIYLLKDVRKKENLKKLASNSFISLLSPKLIIGFNHITIAIEKAITSKFRKTNRSLSKDIIYYSLDNSKLDYCLERHNLFKNDEKSNDNQNESISCFIVIINIKNNVQNDSKSELNEAEALMSLNEDELKVKFDCSVLGIEDYSYYTDFNEIKNEFQISDEEINTDSGIIGAVYNRISLKDIK